MNPLRAAWKIVNTPLTFFISAVYKTSPVPIQFGQLLRALGVSPRLKRLHLVTKMAISNSVWVAMASNNRELCSSLTRRKLRF